MTDSPADDPDIDLPIVGRRRFLKVVGAGVGLVPAVASAQSPMKMPGGAVRPVTPAPYQFFNADEGAFIEAAVDTLIPADPVGPGALEAGVAGYIDRQLAGAFGRGYRLYLSGPFAEGTPQQGWQLAMTPAELVRAGIQDVDAHAMRRHRLNFASLPDAERERLLRDVENGTASLETVPPRFFFDQLLALVVEGYFADPMYGGNKDKSSWRMIGFPGADAMYGDLIVPYRNKLYVVDPQGIQDLS